MNVHDKIVLENLKKEKIWTSAKFLQKSPSD